MKPHPLADLFPLIGQADLEALADDIATNGLHHAIVLYGEPPQVLDGRNRLAACQIAKTEPRFETFTGTEDEALAYVLSTNLHRRHLSTAQKAALAVALLPLEQEAAQRRMLAGRASGGPTQDVVEGAGGTGTPINGEANALAGAKVGISKETVRKAAKIATDAPDVFSAMQDGTVRTLGEATKLAKLDEDRRTKVIATMKTEGVRLKDADGVEPTPWMYRSTGEVEWWTPGNVLEAARRVLGGSIDLDPASCAKANTTVKADRYFDIEQDGLKQPWQSQRLWLNPPYGTDGPRGGNSRQGVWIKKLLEEHAAGRTKQAVVLVRSAPCQAWFQPLWKHRLCFLRRRLEFVPGPGVTGQPVAFSVVVGVGVNVEAFVEVWRDWGQVVVPGDGGVGVSLAHGGG